MQEIEHRCKHCQVRYTYYASGVCDPLNHSDYCPKCWHTVIEALEKVPKVCKKRSEKLSPDSPEYRQVLKKQQEPSGWLKPRQIRCPLFDPESSAILNTEVVVLDQVEYDIMEWSDKRTPPEVYRTLEENVLTGEVVPWRRIWA